MTEVQILAIDLAKRSFQVCATDRAGSCVDAPRFARRFSDFLRLGASSVVCQASGCGFSTPRAGMQFERRGPHRFSELMPLEPRDWFAVS